MNIPVAPYTSEEIRKRIAHFSDLKGFDGGLPDSHYPNAERVLYNVIGFQGQPDSDGGNVVSPVGEEASRNAAIPISEGFNLGYCRAKPGNGPLMHNHDTNETFVILTGRWRMIWEIDGVEEHADIGPWDVCSFPPGVNRRFMNVTYDEPDKTHVLLVVISGDAPGAEFTAGAQQQLKEVGLLPA